jgi:uncharacterized protein (TIGR02147 family)
MKATTTFFSHRYFMNRAGIRSPNFLKNVMDGKKNLTTKTAIKFARAIGMNPKQTEYFYNLVFFNQSTTHQRKQLFYNRLALFSGSIFREIVDSDRASYFSRWYNLIVRELVVIRNYNDNWKMLANDIRPRITPRQAQGAVELLLRLGMLKKSKKGTYMMATPHVSSGDEHVAAVMIRELHKSVLHNAAEAVDTVPAVKRACTSLALSIDQPTMERIKEEFDQFCNRVSLIAHTAEQHDRVYQLALHLFPASSCPKNSGAVQSSAYKRKGDGHDE